MSTQKITPTNPQSRILPDGPWAMHPGRHQQLAADAATINVEVEKPDHPPRLEKVPVAMPGRREAPAEVVIGVLPIVGVIAQRVGDWYGDTYTDRLAERFDELVGSEKVAAVVLDFDTPGGIVSGTPEFAERIFQARATKPIVTVANSFMASAGYWTGAAAGEVVMTPSAEAGSIGVFSAHVDFSKAFEDAGVKVTYVHAGKYKVEGNPHEPLGQEARDEMQRAIDYYYGMFTSAVGRYRGMTPRQVKSDLGDGRLMRAKQAVEAGMADRIATLGEVITALAEKVAARQRSRKAALRRRLDLA